MAKARGASNCNTLGEWDGDQLNLSVDVLVRTKGTQVLGGYLLLYALQPGQYVARIRNGILGKDRQIFVNVVIVVSLPANIPETS